MRPLRTELWRLKLAPPQAAYPVVPRPHADDLAGRTGVVLVQAPAGFGKTSALRSIYERRQTDGERVAWLGLDPADNDPQRFLEYLHAAMQAATGASPAQETADEASAFETVVSSLSELSESDVPFSLFLDDVQVVTDASVVAILRDLCASLPAHGTLFLAGRRLPDLHVGRLRSQGRVLDVGTDDLRLSAAESERLVANILGRSLEPELAGGLHARTEGWAAVLQLAALALTKRSDHAEYVSRFSADSAELGSYLAEEILATQPEEIRELLLRSSICETFCAELCDEVCGRSDSAVLLRQLEHDNLCLSRLGDEGWFRFHDVFADYLRRELRMRHSDLVPELHRRAADWFARHDKKTSALEHARLTGDTEYAADLADAFAEPLVLAGRLTTLMRAAQGLPTTALDRRPRLKVYFTICLAGAFQHRRATPLIEELNTADVMASLDPLTRGALLFAIPFQLLLQDRFEETLAVCERHIPQLDATDAQNRSGIMNVRTVCLLHLRRYHDIDDESRSLATGVTVYGLVYAECLAGMAELAQGRLRHATAIFEAALATALYGSSAGSAPTAIAAACLAEALYEAGDLERAGELLDRYLTTITLLAIPDGVIHAHTHQIRITYRRNGYADACDAVQQLKQLGYERDLSRLVATSWAEHSRLALLRGDLAAAERYVQMAEVSAPYATLWDENGTTLRARLLTAQGRPSDALALLDADLDGLDVGGSRRQGLKLRIIRAIALRAAARTSEALAALAACVDEARGEAFVRVFVDEGAPLAALLRELLATGHGGVEGQAFITSLLEQLDDEHQPAPEPDERQEQLSGRELEVLTHIAAGLSNQAIADTLIISVPTVKTHVRNIMSKLDAKNRTEAVATARRRSLLAR